MLATDVNREPEVERRLGAGARALLIGAPLAMALGRVLLVPLDDQDWDGVLSSMASHRGRSDAGWILAMAASGLLAVTAVVLAGRLGRAGRVRAAMFATVTTAIGWAATAATCLTGLYLSVAATAPDRVAQVKVLDDFNDSAGASFVFLMSVVAAVGYLVLAIGLARASVITKVAAALIGIGGAATLLTMGGPIKPILVVTALLLAAGHGLAARSE
jgi:hypothetical protein